MSDNPPATLPPWDPADGPDPLLLDLRALRGKPIPGGSSFGSMDHLEQITDILDLLGVCYVLAIGRPGFSVTTVWGNSRAWGKPGVECMKTATTYHIEDLLARLEDESPE